jgi:hypothetical protein
MSVLDRYIKDVDDMITKRNLKGLYKYRSIVDLMSTGDTKLKVSKLVAKYSIPDLKTKYLKFKTKKYADLLVARIMCGLTKTELKELLTYINNKLE